MTSLATRAPSAAAVEEEGRSPGEEKADRDASKVPNRSFLAEKEEEDFFGCFDMGRQTARQKAFHKGELKLSLLCFSRVQGRQELLVKITH